MGGRGRGLGTWVALTCGMVRPLPTLFTTVLFLAAAAPAWAEAPAPDRRLEKAQAAFERRQYARALALLGPASEVEAPAVRFMRGISALRSGQPAVAAEALEAVAREDGYPLKDRAAYGAGLAYARTARLEEAARALAMVPPTSTVFVAARWALADVLGRRGEHAEAAMALTELALSEAEVDRSVRAEALYKSAGHWEAAGEKARARDALVTVWAVYPTSRFAAKAEKKLTKKASLEAQVVRAESLVDLHRHHEAMRLVERIQKKTKLPEAAACRAGYAYGKALWKMRQHARVMEVLRPVAKLCPDRELSPKVLYVLGSSESISKDPAAVATYESLIERHPTHALADDALFFAADLEADAGSTSRALEHLSTLTAQYPNGDYAAEGAFRHFFALFKQGAHDDALAAIDRAQDLARDNDSLARARYWRARTLDKAGRASEAAELFLLVSVRHPTTFYGFLARHRLPVATGEAAAALGQVERPAEQEPTPMERPHFMAALELYRLKMPEAAAEFARAGEEPLSRDELRLVIDALVKLGQAKTARALARDAIDAVDFGVGRENAALFELAFPLTYRREVEGAARQAGISPRLLQALVREESAFNPKARSGAGAVGLTQLMPATAREVARRLGTPLHRESALHEPKLALKLGAVYLGQLLTRYGNDPARAIAAYNAGAGRVDRWGVAEAGELDVWVEEIPVAETRRYVKRVLAGYGMYELLTQRGARSAS